MTMRALRKAIGAFVFLFGLVFLAEGAVAQGNLAASAWVEQHASRVRLVAGRAKMARGPYLAGLEIILADGWKTYWRMPGDAGVPPFFDWQGSINVASVKVLYPAPIRMPEAGGESVGYKRSVLLPIEVTPQDAAKPVGLKLALEFGVCRDICIPATAALDLAIPTGPTGAPPAEIEAALERVPRPQQSRRKDDPELKRIAVDGDAASPRLTIEAAFGAGKSADVFVEAPEGLYVPLPKPVPTGDATGVLRFETDLGRDLAQDLKGKTLTVTLVSEIGASEARWTFP
jgi:DsbC/DsbD-like thiol-disulfide interchange protein